MSLADLSLVDLLKSGHSSSTFVCLQIGSFQSTPLFIGGGCYSDALVLWGLSTTTFRLSTTTSFARLTSVFTNLDVIFIISGVCCTAMMVGRDGGGRRVTDHAGKVTSY